MNTRKKQVEERMQRVRCARRLSSVLPRLALAALLLSGCGAGGDPPTPSPGGPAPTQQPDLVVPAGPGLTLGQAWVVFGADTVVAEVARTDAEREKGLMNRSEVPDGTGMLFVFSDARVRTLWMSDTYVALDVAFLNANLRVIDIQQMEPETTTFHDSAAPAMFALEVPKGWFAAHRVRVGARAELVFGPR